MIITIDGPAGSGKSSVAKTLARKLSFAFFESGAMYRALTLGMLNKSVDWTNEQALDLFLKEFNYEIDSSGLENRYFLEGIDISQELRSANVTELVSEVSALAKVRKKLLGIQHDFATKGDCVFEGRDMGSTVFPNAELKFFLVASVDVRAQRRFKEMLEKDPHIEIATVKESIVKRDEIDSNRKFSPLRQADDAIVIDSSSMTLEEVIDRLLSISQEKIQSL